MKAITVKYIPASQTQPSRLKAFDCDGNAVTLSWDEANTDRDRDQAYLWAAQQLCRKMKWPTSLLGGEVKNGYVFVFASTDIR